MSRWTDSVASSLDRSIRAPLRRASFASRKLKDISGINSRELEGSKRTPSRLPGIQIRLLVCAHPLLTEQIRALYRDLRMLILSATREKVWVIG
jgi:hypothetical protein